MYYSPKYKEVSLITKYKEVRLITVDDKMVLYSNRDLSINQSSPSPIQKTHYAYLTTDCKYR